MASPNQKTLTRWHTDSLPRSTKKALDYLAQNTWLKKSRWYLAGGTALALQAGHRSSVDLDFFTQQKDFAIGKLIRRFPQDIWAADIAREGTIYGRLLEAKISFIAYPFFVPAEPFRFYGAVKILDQRDIAVMKIIAISQRGRKRDFVDLYWYCQHRERLGQIFQRLPEQYPNIAHDYHHIVKSLTYFNDAEPDIMPELYFPASWKEIKKFFQQETIKIAREKLLR